MKLLVSRLTLIYFIITPIIGSSQSIEDIVGQLDGNLVKIQTEVGGSGFGFIVGEYQDTFLIATAAHVIMGHDFDLDPTSFSISVQYCGLHQRLPALPMTKIDEQFDIAILKVEKPDNWCWAKKTIGNRPTVAEELSYMGANDRCNSTGICRYDRIEEGKIIFNYVQRLNIGISGAPIIGKNGIVGMIIESEDAFGIATPVSKVIALVTLNSRHISVITRFDGDLCQCDNYDNLNEYKTVRIGDKVWLAQNLAIDIEGSCYYKNDSTYHEKYGRLYRWQAAEQACKKLGPCWRLPDSKDWGALIYYLERDSSIKEKFDLQRGGMGIFSTALNAPNYFSSMRRKGIYWTNSEESDLGIHYNFIGNRAIKMGKDDKRSYYSCRCVKDLQRQ